jgi:hypothetical protein
VRHTETVAESFGSDLAELVTILDSESKRSPEITSLEAWRQRAYAMHLRAAVPRTATTAARSRYTLLIPDWLVASWTISAANTAVSLSDWVSDFIGRVPDCVAAWEAAAAESGQHLSEWIFTVSLGELRQR